MIHGDFEISKCMTLVFAVFEMDHLGTWYLVVKKGGSWSVWNSILDDAGESRVMWISNSSFFGMKKSVSQSPCIWLIEFGPWLNVQFLKSYTREYMNTKNPTQ